MLMRYTAIELELIAAVLLIKKGDVFAVRIAYPGRVERRSATFPVS
mgnify:CR=1